MIVTEEEAKTKRCQQSFGDTSTTPGGYTVAVQYPFGPQGPGYGSAGGGGFAAQTSPSMCIGSTCMAWRWQDSLSPEQQRGAYGYCGKAGKP